MRPALSILVFTVFSGAGLGLLSLTALVELVARAGGTMPPSPERFTVAWAAGWLLVTAGLGASVLHLARPANARFALSRWRTSWLSREGITASVLLVLVPVHASGLDRGSGGIVDAVLALAVVALAWTVLVCTGMIYASLKPIRQWHTRWTPAAYVALGHWSGALILLALWRDSAALPAHAATLAAAVGIAALVAKAGYWAHSASGAGLRTMEQAIGVPHGVRPGTLPGRPPVTAMAARLLDAGHGGATFLTHEFVFVPKPSLRVTLRLVAWAAVFVVPLAWLALAGDLAGGAWAMAILCMIGLLAERWLFFAEARHTVRLFHGDAHT